MVLSVGISSLESFFNLLGVVIVFLAVLGLSYIVTRWLGGSGLLQQWNRNISVIESYKLGPNKYIQIVRIGKKYISIGIGKDTIEYLSEIPEEELDLQSNQEANHKSIESFKEIFSKINKKKEP